MKVWFWSTLALSLAVLGASPTRALACTNDIDCACGEVCSWAAGFQKPHVCVAADGGDPGWCGANADCLYTGQTCKGTSCTPAWSDTSVCVNAVTDAGPDEDAGPAEDAGAADDAGADAGASDDAGTNEDAGSDAGSDAGPTEDAGEGTTGGTTTGGTTTGGTTTGGTTTGGSGASCTNDVDCDCGQVCSWANVNHVCVSASSGDPGWCSGSASDCLYAGQACSGTSCTPAWSETSVCTKGGGSTTGGSTTGGTTTGGGTTGGTGPVCNVDADCSCGDVCSWAHIANNCQTNCGACVSASSGDFGHCDIRGHDAACLYVGQQCIFPYCSPDWSESSVCVSQAGGTTGGTTGGAGTTGGGTTGEGSTTGAQEGTTGGAAASGASGSGTTTGSGAGPSSGGGCSSAGGSFALVIGVLALGLLTRKRRDA